MKTLFLVLVLLGTTLNHTAFAFDALLTDDTSLTLTGKAAKVGTKPTLVVDAKHSALLKFDLSSLPQGRTVSNVLSATMTVFLSRVSKPGAVSLSRVSGDWTEEGIPVVTLTSITGQTAVIGATAKNNFIRFDVTDLVKSWMDGSVVNAGLAIGANASGPGIVIALDSKENTATGHPARLDIEFGDLPQLSQSNKGAWSGTTAYHSGELVTLSGSTWIAVADSTNSQPAQGNADWSILAQKGDVGTQGIAGAFIQSYKGAWSAGTAYAAGDIVTAANSTWLALAGSTNSLPAAANSNWAALALEGQKGDTGNQGAAGTITAGSVTTDKFAALPAVVVNRTITETITAKVDAALNWDQEVIDTAGLHSTSLNSSRLQAPVAGVYLVTLYVVARVDLHYSLWKNGVGSGSELLRQKIDGLSTGFAVSMIIPAVLNAGDYVEAACNFDAAAGTHAYSDSAARFTMVWIGPKQ